MRYWSDTLTLILRQLIFFCLVFLACTSDVQAQGDGPRAYFPTPTGTNTFAAYGLSISGNTVLGSGLVDRSASVDTDILALQYTRTIDVAGRSSGVFVIAPVGSVSGTVAGRFGKLDGESEGLGDLILGGVFTLTGVPSLSKENYASFDPGLAVGVLTKLTIPSGDYSQTRALNLGANRWSLQLGIPVNYYFGSSFLDPNLTVVEVLPSITVFSDNSSAFGGGSLSQDPLFKIESHVSRNLNQAIFVSLDGLWTYGGNTKTNGASNDNKQNSLSMGASLGLNLSKTTSIKFSYGKVVSKNDSGADGDMFRLSFSKLF
jgi:hypothetical protein